LHNKQQNGTSNIQLVISSVADSYLWTTDPWLMQAGMVMLGQVSNMNT